MTNMNSVFEFAYTDCHHDSGPVCVSIHKTIKGAEVASRLHKENERKECEDDDINFDEYSEYALWVITEREVLE
jgi:hypothetical protein